MTVTVREEKIGHYAVYMELKHAYGMEYYEVALYPEHSDGTYGYAINQNIYSMDEKKNANACYRRYRRKAKEMTGVA